MPIIIFRVEVSIEIENIDPRKEPKAMPIESLRQKLQATPPFLLCASIDAKAVKNMLPRDVATQMWTKKFDSKPR